MSLLPIFPWVGGKKYIRTEIIQHFPDPSTYTTYVEPFVGAGSLLLTLLPTHAIVNDLNPWIIMIWHLCSHHPEYVIQQMQSIAKSSKSDETVFYDLLDEFNARSRTVDQRIPSKFVSNDKTSCSCSRQLLRLAFCYFVVVKCSFGAKVPFNKDGIVKCNYGQKPFHWVINNNYLSVHRYLSTNRIEFHVGDYAHVFKQLKGRCLIYFDPPYQATNIRSGVGKYHATRHFVDEDHLDLKRWMDSLSTKHYLVQSNSCTMDVKKLYRSYNIVTLNVRRPLGSLSQQGKSSSTPPNECIITNF